MNKFLLIILITLNSCTTQENKIQNIISESKDTIRTQVINSQLDTKSEILTIPTKNITFNFIKRNDSIFYTSSTNKNEVLIINADQENGESIGEFKTFINSGNKFLLINISSNGTAGFNTDELILIDTIKSKFERVDIKYSTTIQKAKLKTGEEISKDETREYYKDSIIGIFSIGLNTDPGCCPSIGEVKTLYRIMNDNRIWKMQPDTMIFANIN